MLIRNQTIYSSSLVTVPTPHFIVFYNGEDSKEPETTLKLSNAFQQSTTHPELELLVRVLNINLDKNPEILNACQALKEYMLLVERIRTYAKPIIFVKIKRRRLKCVYLNTMKNVKKN